MLPVPSMSIMTTNPRIETIMASNPVTTNLLGSYFLGAKNSDPTRNFANAALPLLVNGSPSYVDSKCARLSRGTGYFDTQIPSRQSLTIVALAKQPATTDTTIAVANYFKDTSGNTTGDTLMTRWVSGNPLVTFYAQTGATTGVTGVGQTRPVVAGEYNVFGSLIVASGLTIGAWAMSETTDPAFSTATLSTRNFSTRTFLIGATYSTTEYLTPTDISAVLIYDGDVGATNMRAIMNWLRNTVGVEAGIWSSPKISDIDMMASTLDSRVTYTGPVHAYMQQSGVIGYTSANQYPLEYRNGVAVGRSLPEPASTNVTTDTYMANLSTTTPGSQEWGVAGWTVPSMTVITGVDGGNGRLAPDINATLFGVYQDGGTAKWLIDDSVVPDSINFGQWTRYSYSATPDANGRVRWYVTRLNANAHLIDRYNSGTAGTKYYFSVFQDRSRTDGIGVSFGQIEVSEHATSPIRNQDNGGTRVASSVKVDTQGAKRLQLIFSDGSSSTYTHPSNPFTLPLADFDWGKKYLTKISFS